MAGQQLTGSSASLALGLQMPAARLGFYVRVEDMNSNPGPHAFILYLFIFETILLDCLSRPGTAEVYKGPSGYSFSRALPTLGSSFPLNKV